MSYLDRVARALAEREGDAPVPEPERAEPKRDPAPEPEPPHWCGHCCTFDHAVEFKCASRVWDEASDLLYRLREAGAVVTIEPGDVVRVRGYVPDEVMAQAIREQKAALLVALRFETEAAG